MSTNDDLEYAIAVIADVYEQGYARRLIAAAQEDGNAAAAIALAEHLEDTIDENGECTGGPDAAAECRAMELRLVPDLHD